MELTSIDNVRGRLKLPEDEGIDGTITSAIAAGDPALSVRLQTPFVEASYVDVYNVNASRVVPYDGFIRLRTRAGFIQEDSLVVSCGYSLVEAKAQTTLIPSTDVVVDLEKGWVLISETYLGNYVALSYDAGFASVDSVPGWLQEAATCHAITMMSIHQMDDKNPELTTTLKTLQEQITMILNGHLRTNRTALSPLK